MRGAAAQVELAALMTREFRGDLSPRLDGFGDVLGRLREPPDEALLRACVVPQPRKREPSALGC